MLRTNILAVIFLLISPGYVPAQEDSTETDQEWDWHWDEWGDWNDWDFDFGFRNKKPAISLQYGLAETGRKDLGSGLADPGLLEIKLGYVKDKSAWETENIINHQYRFLYLSNESNKLSGKDAAGPDIASDMWRFGFGRSGGYGYKLGESAAIIPYNSYTLNWSRIDYTYPDFMTVVTADYDKLELYDESFRFGTSSEGGIRIKLIDNLMLDAGYERSIVFQRHLFWKWAGSAAIEAAAQGLLDGFIHEIFESSPAAGPIVNFVLKNALAYGIYELRKDKMNWPFNSESPVTYDQFKFGMTFVF